MSSPIKSILNFILGLFGKKQTNNNCDNCTPKDQNAKNKYALIVGMENSKWGLCSGSTKDSDTMNNLIKQYTSNIVRLNDKNGTVANVRKALEEQIAKVPEDGLFIFTYSGHGGQHSKSSGSKDETDGQDEFLCLYDGELIDNDLWVIFNKCKGRIVFIPDCCHSSTIFRLPAENPEENDEVLPEREPLETPFFSKFENVRASGVRMLVFAGCGEDTVSWGDAKQGGVMTSSMNRAFNKNLTYKEWWNKFKADSAFKKVKQTPVCTKIGAFDLNVKVFN